MMLFICTVVFFVWTAPLWVAHTVYLQQTKASGCCIKSLGDFIASIFFGPFCYFVYRSEYKDWWVKTNFSDIQEMLQSWNVNIKLTEANYAESQALDIWWHGSTPKHRVRSARFVRQHYKILKDLEKMSVYDWSVKYLPFTEEYKIKFDSKNKFKSFKG